MTSHASRSLEIAGARLEGEAEARPPQRREGGEAGGEARPPRHTRRRLTALRHPSTAVGSAAGASGGSSPERLRGGGEESAAARTVRGGSRHASRTMPRARSTSARAASRGCAIDSMRETEGTLHERRGRPRSTCVIVERVSKWEWVSGRCTVLHCMGVRPLQRHMRRPSRVCGCGSVQRVLQTQGTHNRVCHTFTVCGAFAGVRGR